MNNELLKLELSDNGKGFNINTTKSKGRGLMTMKNRIESINGKILFKSHQGIGTTLKIEIKCKKH